MSEMSEMNEYFSIGETFKPFAWKANFDMDFSSECLYCDSSVSGLQGYVVEDAKGGSQRIAICPACQRVNARY
ncbi:hypothetical protein PP175_07405 [Aneurinibacillus sp. Ricciae_BoGa-3]|uniref:hypothetical protein n=1 Tax=Aneurinibacillus sp. Ricciae_BoGa-3 TaxID=3022697 RepID=UPI00234232DC|nr:hypothetical protein [Aneurinibacillus sp. Ricciae_BoGa-3]WCK55758.1 hypothetical protein PP175_07405 [Aneurinibacillus sp. Ricciae_BoGa-3]